MPTLDTSITGKYHDRVCSNRLLQILWILAAGALMTSLFVVDSSGESQYIYLRAAGILYLSLSLSDVEIATRGVRGGMGCLIVILAIGGNKFYAENIPLYGATFLIVLHVVLTILTTPGGLYHIASGVRGLLVTLCAAFCSTVCIAAGVYSDQEELGIARAVAYGLTGLPLLMLINGIPQAERHQLIGSYSCLIPIAGAMYLIGDLNTYAPWVVAGAGVISGTLVCAICITITKTWRASLMQMLAYLIDGRTTAFFLMILLTFGNIACINGLSYSVETAMKFGNSTVPGVSEDNPTKEIEETIPLILLGLAKGGLAIIIIKSLKTNAAEVSGWAISTVLCVASLILLGIEGRGRCLFQNTSSCDTYRSKGFISGMSITAIGALVCLIRAIYTGRYVPWKQEQTKKQLARMLNENAAPTIKWKERAMRYLKERIFLSRDMSVALAVGALLTCLISTSYVDVELINSNESNYTGSEALLEILNWKASELEEYWKTTSWMVAAAVCALSILAVETLPKSPSVAVSILAGLLLTAGRLHYACLLSEANTRINAVGLIYIYEVRLNIYIVSVISIVVGLSWGSAVTDTGEEDVKRVRTTVGNKAELILTVSRKEGEKQSFEEVFCILEQQNLLKYMLSSGLMRDWSGEKSCKVSSCSWSLNGRCELEDGTYEIYKNSEELIQLALACSESIGTLSVSRQVVPVRVFAPFEAKESVGKLISVSTEVQN